MLTKEFSEETKIAFGKYQWERLRDIPNSYFIWLSKQKWFNESKLEYYIQLKKWIEKQKNTQ